MRTDLSDPTTLGGHSTLDGTILEALEFMLEPLVTGMERALRVNGRPDLVDKIENYVWFRVGLGMVRPVRIDDLWDTSSLNFNKYLANVLSRQDYYHLVKYSKGNIGGILERCSLKWAQGWVLGKAAAGDETIIPFKGKTGLRQFVPRKPHNTGLKLYCLADCVHAYTVDVYLYTGKRGIVRPATPAVGRFNPAAIVQRWGDLLPEGCALVCDSYFGTMPTAESLHDRRIPFLLLTKKKTRGIPELSQGCPPGSFRTERHERGFTVAVYKNPQQGTRPPKTVPFLYNCRFRNEPVMHKNGYRLPRPVYCYRRLAGGVDTANQLALQHREVGRCSTWSQAARQFLIRYALVNAFATCHTRRLIPHKESLLAFRWACMKAVCGQPLQQPVREAAHVPVRMEKRKSCQGVGCGSRGSTIWRCSACDCPLHIACFAAHHGV